MRTPHTHYPKGTRIRVVLRNGTEIVDKFEDAKSGVMILRAHGRIPKKDIRSTGIYKADAPQPKAE